jgi:hypothetical protein
MKARTLTGKEIQIENRPSQYPMRNEDGCKSALQYTTGQQVKLKYPFDPILEDVYIPECGFYFDFWLPKRKIAVEIQGEQHNKFVKFFHKNEAGFREHQERDQRKKDFCRLNSIKLIEIFTEDDWTLL